jgi:hypothetical protein
MVLLEYPRENSQIDLSWIGSWEELLGEARPVHAPIVPATDDLFTEAEMRGEPVAATDYTFVVGADAAQQGQTIALLCSRFLADQDSRRVGIVFSGTGSLPRLVASELSNLEIPHNDARVTAKLHDLAVVYEQRVTDGAMLITAWIPRDALHQFEPYAAASLLKPAKVS